MNKKARVRGLRAGRTRRRRQRRAWPRFKGGTEQAAGASKCGPPAPALCAAPPASVSAPTRGRVPGHGVLVGPYQAHGWLCCIVQLQRSQGLDNTARWAAPPACASALMGRRAKRQGPALVHMCVMESGGLARKGGPLFRVYGAGHVGATSQGAPHRQQLGTDQGLGLGGRREGKEFVQTGWPCGRHRRHAPWPAMMSGGGRAGAAEGWPLGRAARGGERALDAPRHWLRWGGTFQGDTRQGRGPDPRRGQGTFLGAGAVDRSSRACATAAKGDGDSKA
jgi:hypothetical protein